ncbi:TetR-like C-terminal domain-containing protein [Antribacter gilvus]|uniref:TetR-like C-terminal domain-containing protein n=1 Tax=Antribacter gilvus TaxID=2304675 RepID=UPI000F786E33|nr:TetR-like C-terminal domain-containing protein [Antribacter gilvus]
MARAGLSPRAVVDAAVAVVDADGPAALTLAAVAARTGVATPSLYKHVGGLGELRTLVSLRFLEELGDVVTAAGLGRSGDDAVSALLHGWRRYVLDHPHRYAFVPLAPLTDPVLEAAGKRVLDVFAAVLAGYGLSGAEAVHAMRRARAVVHGFASLEAAGGFAMAEDVDASFEGVVAMVVASLR